MQIATCYLVAAAMAATVTAGREKTTNGNSRVVTVCEVLADVNKYADSDVIVIGHEERSVSVVDHYEFLTQDGCEHPVATHGHTWSNRMQIWAGWEDGMPKPPVKRPKFEPRVLWSKLWAIRKTTSLGTHEEPRFKASCDSILYDGRVVVPNRWVVVYGRLVKVLNLDKVVGLKAAAE